MISLDNIKQSQKIISEYIRKTEIKLIEDFKKKTGINLYIKLENFQNSGSFKMRGACNKILTLTDEERKNGVICSSAGNHAQGVAYSSTALGIKSTIVMPKTTPVFKLKSTIDYGGNVIQYGETYDEAYTKAMEIQKETNATFIHPFDDPKVIEGQATIALEILEQLDKIDTILVSIGGGGILAGIAYTIKQIKPSVKIIGVQAENAPAMKISFDKKQNTIHPVTPTIADGIAVAKPGSLTFDIIKEYVDDIITVSESEISKTIVFLLEKCKIVSEGAGAACLAPVISGRVGKKGENIVSVISGGNIDISLLEKIINKELISSGRRFKYTTIIRDKTEILANIINKVVSLEGHIISINQDKHQENLLVNEYLLSLIIDTKDMKHKELIISELEKFKIFSPQ